jgi:phosphatidylglycerophosphate synthase
LKKNIANFLTVIRIVLAFVLLFFLREKDQTVFLTLYSIAWVTDGLDGRIARMLKTQSDFGSKLDDIGDTLLGIVMGISIFSWIGFELFNFLPYAVPLILIRIFNIFYTKKKYGKPYVIHTYGNKLTSFIAFLLPIYYVVASNYTSKSPFTLFYVVIIVGTLASLEECIIHIISGKYNYKRKSIFMSLPQEEEAQTVEEDSKKTI